MMHQIIMTLVSISIPVIIAGFGTFLAKYIKTKDSFRALQTLVNAGVVFAEKTGLDKQLTGSEQFKVAYDFVEGQLSKLGITSADEELIKGLIEQSWAKQKDQLENIYDQRDQASKSEAKPQPVKGSTEPVQAEPAQSSANTSQVSTDDAK